MATLKHSCDNCDSTFSINYDVNTVEDDPHYCPFCGEYILDSEDFDEEDE